MKTIVELATLKQPHPKKGDKRVLDIVRPGLYRGSIRDGELAECLEERASAGLAKYKTYLETNNGRDPLVDAFQEVIDLVMYLGQYRAESEVGDSEGNSHNLFQEARCLTHSIMRELEYRYGIEKGTNGG